MRQMRLKLAIRHELSVSVDRWRGLRHWQPGSIDSSVVLVTVCSLLRMLTIKSFTAGAHLKKAADGAIRYDLTLAVCLPNPAGNGIIRRLADATNEKSRSLSLFCHEERL